MGPGAAASSSRAEHGPAIDKAIFPGIQGGPLEHVIAAKAIAFGEAASPDFSRYAESIVANARAMAEALAGHGFRLVSGGTDNHLLLVDLRSFDEELTGKEAQAVLDEAGVSLNKNTIPDDPRSPFVTSGVRIGTPAVTTQGMGEAEMATIASLSARALRDRHDPPALAAVSRRRRALRAVPAVSRPQGLSRRRPRACAVGLSRGRCGRGARDVRGGALRPAPLRPPGNAVAEPDERRPSRAHAPEAAAMMAGLVVAFVVRPRWTSSRASWRRHRDDRCGGRSGDHLERGLRRRRP
ncbi:MAG: hypothetical protein R2695_05360 [Acidimicrobiales bacterium]